MALLCRHSGWRPRWWVDSHSAGREASSVYGHGLSARGEGCATGATLLARRPPPPPPHMSRARLPLAVKAAGGAPGGGVLDKKATAPGRSSEFDLGCARADASSRCRFRPDLSIGSTRGFLHRFVCCCLLPGSAHSTPPPVDTPCRRRRRSARGGTWRGRATLQHTLRGDDARGMCVVCVVRAAW